MPWPGAPASASSPPLNAPSTRLPSDLGSKAHPDVAEAISAAFDGLTVHEQAFAALPAQIEAAKAAVQQSITENITTTGETVEGVTAFNSQTGAVIYFPALGMMNDQLGNPVYLTQASDNGAKIVMGDSTSATVTLNSSVTAPWFAMIDNDSGSTVALSVDSGSGQVFGASTIPPGGFGIVFFDGTNFWCGATVMATASSPGYVQPDAVSIGIDSGLLHTIGASGTIPLGPLTDSGATGSIQVANGRITSWISPT
jgi:hypothetical protein